MKCLMKSVPRRDGTEKETQGRARFGLEILVRLETLDDQQRVYVGDERAHYMLCSHRRIYRVEFARRDALSQNALGNRMHDLLMGADDVHAMLDRDENHVMDAAFGQKIVPVMSDDRHDELFEALARWAG